MSTAQQLEIRCSTCGYWMPYAPAEAGPPPATDAATLAGTVVKCRKCLQRTTAAADNVRVHTPLFFHGNA